MDNTIENAIAKARQNKWVKLIGWSALLMLTSWMLVNIALAMGIMTDYQKEWDSNRLERCEIERDWCKYKMTNPDNYTVEDLQRCAAKSKMTCDFQ